jgi:hypothetical protein
LWRGRILYALFPFTTQLPVRLSKGARYGTIEEFATVEHGAPAEIVVEARLRPVLLVHDGTRGEHGDVICLRVNSVKPGLKSDAEVWRRIVEQRHPAFFHLPATATHHGLPRESVIAISSIGTVSKSALLRPAVGGLTHAELQQVNERLARELQLDLAPLVAERARELLRRAGITPSDAV